MTFNRTTSLIFLYTRQAQFCSLISIILTSTITLFPHDFTQSSLPDALYLQYIWICSIEWGHKAAHRNVFHPGDCKGVGVEDRALVVVLDCDMDSGRGAGAVANIRNQRILVLYFNE